MVILSPGFTTKVSFTDNFSAGGAGREEERYKGEALAIFHEQLCFLPTAKLQVS